MNVCHLHSHKYVRIYIRRMAYVIYHVSPIQCLKPSRAARPLSLATVSLVSFEWIGHDSVARGRQPRMRLQIPRVKRVEDVERN